MAIEVTRRLLLPVRRDGQFPSSSTFISRGIVISSGEKIDTIISEDTLYIITEDTKYIIQE